MTIDPTPFINAWCSEQLLRWKAKRPSAAESYQYYQQLLHENFTVFLFRIKNGVVAQPESRHFSPTDYDLRANVYVKRARQYAEFLQAVVTEYSVDIDVAFAFDCTDIGTANEDFAVFNFQKTSESPAILLPDPDFLSLNFYDVNEFCDVVQYVDKRDSAIFVGSTSGGHITQQVVRDLSLPRLRAGSYFKSVHNVKFLLPNIVQCDSPETEQSIRELGFGVGQTSWSDQFKEKFLLSMDGNGATCSRVVLALKSNSILLKYNSPHQLFYFKSMLPWLHYIPIQHDSDVANIIKVEAESPGELEYIAVQSKIFADRLLSKSVISLYTSRLLDGFATALSRAPQVRGSPPLLPPPNVDSLHPPGGNKVLLCAHVANRGDVWGYSNEWLPARSSAQPIEGIQIQSGLGMSLDDLRYNVLFMDGTTSEWSEIGSFAGTSGQNRQIKGFNITLKPEIAEKIRCDYSGIFLDGSESGPVPAGEVCTSTTGSVLVALRVDFLEIAT